ncbi:MAG: hypothetical protein ACYSR8_01480 [Planctomycetota bacterium]|jgi:hypothetical protein
MKITRLVPKYADADQVLKRYCRKNFKAPCSLELVYLPFVLFDYKIDALSLFGKRKSESGFFLVDLIQGIPINVKKNTFFDFIDANLKEQFSKLTGEDSAKDEKTVIVKIQSEEVDPQQLLPTVIDRQTAVEKGKKLLMYDIMKLAGALRYKKVDIVPGLQRKVLYYPHWLVYYRDRKNNMKFDVFDALNGQKEGGQIIRSVKIGLLKKHENLTEGVSEN